MRERNGFERLNVEEEEEEEKGWVCVCVTCGRTKESVMVRE